MVEQRSGRITRAGVLLGLVGAGLAAAYALRDRLPTGSMRGDAAALPPVSAAPANASAAGASRIAALGRLQPRDGVRRIAGPAQAVAVVGELLVDEGDRVGKGQLLARLDDAELRAARVERAGARLANAKAELARSAELWDGRVISESRHDQLRLEHDVAVADLRLARAELARVEVRSPIAGRVIEVHARAGERVGPEGIVELGETDAMYAVAEIYETDVVGVEEGASAEITSPALPRPLRGEVERIALRVAKQDVLGTDPAARTDARIVEVEVRLVEEDARLVAGLTHLQVEVAIVRGAD